MNFGSLLGAVSRVLPGYMEGERQAVRDNWQDLQNYNNVQMGQLGNLFLEGTMPQRFQMFNDQAYRSSLQSIVDSINTAIQFYGAPGQMYGAATQSRNAPVLEPLSSQAQYNAYMTALRNPMAFFGGGANGARATTPYGVRQ